MLSSQERASSFRLLESVFPKGSDAQRVYNSIPLERNTVGFPLFSPLPEMYREDVFSYANVICRNDNDKSMLRDHLKSYNRADAADLLVKSMMKHRSLLPEEEAIVVIEKGIDLFEQLTGFHTEVISEDTLGALLPESSFPREIDFLSALLNIRREFLLVFNNGSTSLAYESNSTKAKILTYGLGMVPKNKSREEDSTNFFRKNNPESYSLFYEEEIVEAFRALSGYNLYTEIED